MECTENNILNSILIVSQVITICVCVHDQHSNA